MDGNDLHWPLSGYDTVKEEMFKLIHDQQFSYLFITVSGAHLYGFSSPDSDIDLRGSHILPLQEVLGFKQMEETRELTTMIDHVEIDLVTHDIKKYFVMLLKKNGYVFRRLSAFNRAQTSKPSISGMRISNRIRSGGSIRLDCSAAGPLGKERTV